jgi:hypothetical protein
MQSGPRVQQQLYHRKTTIAQFFVRTAFKCTLYNNENSKTYLTLIRFSVNNQFQFRLFPPKFTQKKYFNDDFNHSIESFRLKLC